MDKIVKKIKNLSEKGSLLIDYGYLNVMNKNTLQAVMRNKRIDMSHLYENLGKTVITLVNFSLLKEYFIKINLKLKK